MNTITLGGKTVYDVPRDALGTNYFLMHTGAARYGFGQFCLSRTDYDALATATAADGFTTLIMQSGDDSAQSLTLPVVLAGARPMQTGLGEDTSLDMVWATVFDKRCKLRSTVRGAFNCQKEGFPLNGSDAPIFYTSTLNGSSEWTWTNALEAAPLEMVAAQFSGSILPTSWKPRNLIFDQIPKANAIDQVAGMLYAVVGFDWTTGKVILYPPDTMTTANGTVKTAAEVNKIAGRATVRHSMRYAGVYKATFRSVNLDADDPFTNRAYEKSTTVAGGDSGVTQPLFIGEYVAIRRSSAWVNQAELDIVAADMASRASLSQRASLDERKYAGIWPFKPDGAIRGILWESGRKGATTTIRLNDDRDWSPMDDTKRAIEAVSNSLVIGLGATGTAVGQGGQRYVWGAGATLPTGEYQYMSYQMVSQNAGGWDFARAHPVL